MKTIIAPETLSKEWQELISKHQTPSYSEKLDDELTVEEYAKCIGKSFSRARVILREEVNAGRMAKRFLAKDMTQIAVYHPIIQKEQSTLEQEQKKRE